MNLNQKTARTAGLLYLIIAICTGFAAMGVRLNLTVAGDVTTTASNILANESLFRLGFLIDLIAHPVFVLLVLFLYKLFRTVNKNYASLMVIFVLVSIPITAINMLNHIAPLIILKNPDFMAAFSAKQLNTGVMFFLDLHNYGYLIGQIFHGLWLFPLGILVFKSRFLPRILGVLLMLACFGYLTDCFTIFLFPNYGTIVSPIAMIPAAIGEMSFCFWMLIRGINLSKIESIDKTKKKT